MLNRYGRYFVVALILVGLVGLGGVFDAQADVAKGKTPTPSYSPSMHSRLQSAAGPAYMEDPARPGVCVIDPHGDLSEALYRR